MAHSSNRNKTSPSRARWPIYHERGQTPLGQGSTIPTTAILAASIQMMDQAKIRGPLKNKILSAISDSWATQNPSAKNGGFPLKLSRPRIENQAPCASISDKEWLWKRRERLTKVRNHSFQRSLSRRIFVRRKGPPTVFTALIYIRDRFRRDEVYSPSLLTAAL